ncbi:3,4-dihydroxy-2-butanone-4-phosphate synthase [ANME-1 cluster archaeon ex4572_4]|nr:3,4-dihydroxy-2-butanone-4-phosphate synthase [Methanophagales archaeon]OYT66301.1 MAG: 3,4-dihydroxy-2-butanone-4-phosphate synthase [ANME-1 cluster archaeon ex4572_4]
MKIPDSVERGIEEVKKGRLVLIYDAEDREGETDFVLPASFVTPRKVAYFRREAGGLICVAVHAAAAERLGLPLMSDILRNFAPLKKMVEGTGDLSYDRRSSFSLWVNHRETFTGITDRDRSLTIKKVGEAVEKVLSGKDYDFYSEFRTPGHVSILRAANGLLEERRGQTELSVALALLAGISPPAAVICEMLDSKTGNAVSKSDAKSFAAERGLVFLEGKEIIKAYKTFF